MATVFVLWKLQSIKHGQCKTQNSKKKNLKKRHYSHLTCVRILHGDVSVARLMLNSFMNCPHSMSTCGVLIHDNDPLNLTLDNISCVLCNDESSGHTNTQHKRQKCANDEIAVFLPSPVECPVCKDEVNQSIALKCGHLVCEPCRTELSSSQNHRCPTCRVNIRPLAFTR